MFSVDPMRSIYGGETLSSLDLSTYATVVPHYTARKSIINLTSSVLGALAYVKCPNNRIIVVGKVQVQYLLRVWHGQITIHFTLFPLLIRGCAVRSLPLQANRWFQSICVACSVTMRVAHRDCRVHGHSNSSNMCTSGARLSAERQDLANVIKWRCSVGWLGREPKWLSAVLHHRWMPNGKSAREIHTAAV